jgi:N-carbamoylputrescine amidase
MKVTVCEFGNDPLGLEQDWKSLVGHVKSEKSDLVLLPEMAFYRWVAGTRNVDPGIWEQAVSAHDRWMERLSDLAPAAVTGTRPVIQDGKRHNEGFIWESETGCRPSHVKYYLPNEKGFWEATWYERGKRDFKAIDCKGIHLGFLICTELWFFEHAREYLKQGIHLLVCPRVTPKTSVEKWITGGRAAAVVSGAFCLSSNLSGPNTENIEFGGTGWVIEPEEGSVLGVTSPEKPFLTVEIDLKKAEKAKFTYPRYVAD